MVVEVFFSNLKYMIGIYLSNYCNMDECNLCKDTIATIFSFAPSQYATFVRLCREAKSVLRAANVDGWDALVAQGCDIRITRSAISWYKNGKQHRNIGPAYIHGTVYLNGTRTEYYIATATFLRE